MSVIEVPSGVCASGEARGTVVRVDQQRSRPKPEVAVFGEMTVRFCRFAHVANLSVQRHFEFFRYHGNRLLRRYGAHRVPRGLLMSTPAHARVAMSTDVASTWR